MVSIILRTFLMISSNPCQANFYEKRPYTKIENFTLGSDKLKTRDQN